MKTSIFAAEATIHSRRQIIASLTLTLMAVLLPFRADSAFARNGNGRGGGDGDAGGRGGGNGTGHGGGSGHAGNKGASGDRGSGKASKGDARDAGPGRPGGKTSGAQNNSFSGKSDRSSTPRSSDPGGMAVRHRNGIAEEVDRQGRYVMRDNRGRTIVNRAATKSDLDRLRSFFD